MFPYISNAQDEEKSCDPEQVHTWLTERQKWRNASSDILDDINESGISNPFLIFSELLRHSQVINDLERPECADEMMLWTYFYYNALVRRILCWGLDDGSCIQDMDIRLDAYNEQINIVAKPLEELSEWNYEEYLDLRPDGWLWPPEELGTSGIITETYSDGMLDFEGTIDVVTDPIGVPEGIYRATLKTADQAVNIEMVVLEGECYVGNTSWNKSLFSYSENGAQSVLTSKGCKLIWQAENVHSSFNVTFEKVQ
jgi:hypothetical protein